MPDETSKTVISINKPSPVWSTYLFRIVFLLTTAATMVIVADPSIPDNLKVRIGAYLKGLDFLIWGMSRMLGVDINAVELQKK